MDMGKDPKGALASVAQLVGMSSCNQKVADLIPSQGTYVGCGFHFPVQVHKIPRQVCMGGNQSMLPSHIDVSLSLKPIKNVLE